MTISAIRLPSLKAPPEQRYSMPNPDHRPAAYRAVYDWLWYSGPQPEREDLLQVLNLANGYRALTVYHGQEDAVGKLRDVWRHRRASGAEAAAGASDDE